MTTFQVSVTDICDGNCPFCISKMTYRVNHNKFNWDRLQDCIYFAQSKGIHIAKITGKWGEPLMVPELITGLLPYLQDFDIELQTNAKKVFNLRSRWNSWKILGLGLVSISCVHWDKKINDRIYSNSAHLPSVINVLKASGYKVRLNCLLIDGLIDSPDDINKFVNQFPNADQISFIPIGFSTKPEAAGADAYRWARNHKINPKKMRAIIASLDSNHILKDLTSYSRTYIHEEQSIYIADCLKIPVVKDEYRHLIYFPDGTLRYSWEDVDSIVDIK